MIKERKKAGFFPVTVPCLIDDVEVFK